MATAAEEARRRFFEGGAGTSGSGFGGRSARRVAPAPQRAAAVPADRNMAEFMAFGARKAAREARIKTGDQKHSREMANLGHMNAKGLLTHQGGIQSARDVLLHGQTAEREAQKNKYEMGQDNRKLISDAILAGAQVTPGMEGVYGTQGPFNPNLADAGIKIPGTSSNQKGYGVVQVGTGDDSNPTFGLLNKDTGELNSANIQNPGGFGAGTDLPQAPSGDQPADQEAVVSLARQYLQASREGRAKLLRDNPAMIPHLKSYLTASLQQEGQ